MWSRHSIWCAVVMLVLTAPAPAQIVGGRWEAWTAGYGSDVFGAATFGRTILGFHDFDGDGCDDFFVGAPSSESTSHEGGSLLLYSGRSGLVLWEHAGNPYQPDGFATSVSLVPDLDGDHTPELVIGVTGTNGTIGLLDVGSISVYSGATLVEWDRVKGDVAFGYLGSAVSNAGDVNGDGLPDILAGAPNADVGGFTAAGYARLISGADLTTLRTYAGSADGDALGASVLGVGDWSGDGVPDQVLGAPLATVSGMPEAGRIEIRSGADGALLGSLSGGAAGDRFGFRLANVGDLDGDGFDDCLIGAPGADPAGLQDAGSAFLLTRTGSIAQRFDGSGAGEQFGHGIAAAGDVDRDGVPDLLFGAPLASAPGLAFAGSARIVSGATRTMIHSFFGDVAGEQLGYGVAAAGDVNDDGILDVLIGAPYSGSPYHGRGIAFAVNPFLVTSSDSLSAAAGGAVQFDLTFPPEFGSGEFAILASARGSGPTTIGGLAVPLTADALFGRTLAGNYPIGAVNFSGQLSSRAETGALFFAPPGSLPAPWIGRTLYFAAVARDPQGGAISSIHRQLLLFP